MKKKKIVTGQSIAGNSGNDKEGPRRDPPTGAADGDSGRSYPRDQSPSESLAVHQLSTTMARTGQPVGLLYAYALRQHGG